MSGIVYVKLQTEKHFFRDDAAPEIKALADNLNVHANPPWDRAAE
jgi:hypothetical protein